MAHRLAADDGQHGGGLRGDGRPSGIHRQSLPAGAQDGTAHRGHAVDPEVARIWQGATKRMRIATLRCSDFYGPGVAVSHLGASAFGELAKNKPAQLLVPADRLHDLPMFPTSPAPRSCCSMRPMRISARRGTCLARRPAPRGRCWPWAPLRWGSACECGPSPSYCCGRSGWCIVLLREVADVGFTWDRPYIVDSGKFTRRFGFAPTPFELGMPATVHAFVEAAGAPGKPDIG